MVRFTPLQFIPVLIAAASHAGEITIESRAFRIESTFSATALPNSEGMLLRFSPKIWKDYEIVEISDHGSKVSKGDLLVSFDTEEIDKKLEDAQLALESSALSLAQAALDLKNLIATSPHRLEAIRRSAEIAEEEHTYFTQVRRKADEETAAQSLKRYEQILSNQREELKQLSKMYEADDITENTEEIILVRQQDAVAAAEFALRMEALEHKRALDVSLPREAKKLSDSQRDTAITFTKAEVEIPRALELSKLAVATAKTTHQRAKKNLTELGADRAQFEYKAPADGWFYHGPIENGRWSLGDVAKHLVPHGKPPTHAAFATFVPVTAELSLISFLDEATARAMTPDIGGMATLAGREELEIPVKLLKLAAVPNAAGAYRADLAAVWPEKFTPTIGATAQVRLIVYQKETAISVPTKALRYESGGWTVETKLADGKTEHRSVKCGRISGDQTEILSGLEVGQVIIVL